MCQTNHSSMISCLSHTQIPQCSVSPTSPWGPQMVYVFAPSQISENWEQKHGLSGPRGLVWETINSFQSVCRSVYDLGCKMQTTGQLGNLLDVYVVLMFTGLPVGICIRIYRVYAFIISDSKINLGQIRPTLHFPLILIPQKICMWFRTKIAYINLHW